MIEKFICLIFYEFLYVYCLRMQERIIHTFSNKLNVLKSFLKNKFKIKKFIIKFIKGYNHEFMRLIVHPWSSNVLQKVAHNVWETFENHNDPPPRISIICDESTAGAPHTISFLLIMYNYTFLMHLHTHTIRNVISNRYD